MSSSRSNNARGIALIEVLVSLVILLFGLLGLVGISSRANLSELEAYQRVHALQLLQDMADRLNANRKVAACYSNGATGVTLGNGSTTVPDCTAGTVQERTRAAADLAAWDAMLKGAAETQGDSKLGGMIGAVGCVTQESAADSIYLIDVAWQGLAETAAHLLADDKTKFPCGADAYGKEKLHRVATTKVRIGALK